LETGSGFSTIRKDDANNLTGMPAKKILLVQLFSNGDCLYVTAVARQIKNDFPGCHLVWAIASFCKDIIAENPFVDEILEVNSVPKNDIEAFRRFKKEAYRQKDAGKFDEVFVTQNMDTNQAYYDGTIRGGLLRAYPFPVTVPVTPILRLNEREKEKAKEFARRHQLDRYRNVVLFEFAPQSGQLNMTRQFVMTVAEGIVNNNDAAVVLSSGQAMDHTDPRIIDGSVLTLRETAALTHYCTLLLGCSSGISWISTSDAARAMPMIQLIDPNARWINAVSRDFERFHLPATTVIDLTNFDETKVIHCVGHALDRFDEARSKYNQSIPLQFRTTTSIVYNLLCYLEFGAIRTHIKVNREVYGNYRAFNAAVVRAFLFFPFTLIRNLITKRFRHKKINSL
jgi:hypothetical protein